MNKFGALITASVVSLALAGCSATSDDGDASNDVTLSGVVTDPSAAAAPGIAAGVAPTGIENYSLYCVTFTNPPNSGNGSFDATGNYSVTVTDAAGLPVGCFINDQNNAPVATLTFTVGSDTSSAAALGGGAHTIDINFNPTTGVASATVAETALATGDDTTDDASFITNMAGSWNMTCADSTDAACAQFIGSSPTVFVDIISGTDNTSGETLYAMGAWPNETAYINCGSTEGLSAAALANEGITAGSASGSTGANAVTGTFSGAVAALAAGSSYAYNSSTDQMEISFADLYLNGPAYDATFDDGMGNYCTNTSLSMNVDQDRSCYLWFVSEQIESGAISCAPRVRGDAWQLAWAVGTTSATPIPLAATLGASPDINDRYALMGLQIVGGNGVAYNEFDEEWTQYDEATMTNESCYYREELTITFAPDSTGTSAVGTFAQKQYDSCGGGNSYAVFDVNFSKP